MFLVSARDWGKGRIKIKDNRELKIRQLKDQSDYQKFEINLVYMAFFSIMSIIVALMLGISMNVQNPDIQIIISLIFIVLTLIVGIIIGKYIKPRINKIKNLSKEIQKLYEELQNVV